MEGGPTLRVSGDAEDRSAGFAGLVSCGIMSCPCCAAKVGNRRAEEIEQVVDRVHAEGGSAALLTLTVRHHRGQRLAPLWDGLTHAWSRVTSGRRYAREVDTFGITGWVGVVEAPHGDAGWHPHRHVLVLFDTPMSPEMVTALSERWWDRWAPALQRRGLDAVEHRGGLDVRVVSRDGSGGLGEYLSKIAHEVSGSPTKRGRRGSRTPFELLADFDAYGDADAYDLFVEYEQTAQRRRTLTWSKGTRERYGLHREQTTQEIAEEDAGGDDLLALPNETWGQIRDRAETLLAAAERDGLVGAQAWLTARGLSFTRVASRDRYDRASAEAARADHQRRQERRRWRTLI